jgi:phosphate transport system permease protein
MRLETRKLLDKAFSGFGLIAIAVMAVALVLILAPIVWRGSKAFVFRGTIEHRRVMLEQFTRGNPEAFNQEMEQAAEARAPVYRMLADFKADMKAMPSSERREYRAAYKEVEKAIKVLLGPMPGQKKPVLLRQQYGQTRWDRTQVKLHEVLYTEEWDYSNPDAMGLLVEKPRVDRFTDTRGTDVSIPGGSPAGDDASENHLLLAIHHRHLKGFTHLRRDLAGGPGYHLSDPRGHDFCHSDGGHRRHLSL